MIITTVGLPVSFSRRISCSCSPTRSKLSRSVSSPDVRSFQRNRIIYSPQHTMLRSHSLAASTAASTWACDMLRGSHPWSTKRKSVVGATLFNPRKTVHACSSGCGSLQSPIMFWSLALMPVTNTFLYFCASRGNRLLAFFSKTMLLRAASRAVRLCSGSLITRSRVFTSL